MRALFAGALLALVGFGCRTHEAALQTDHPSTLFTGWQSPHGEQVEVTCKPAYYLREHDIVLVPADAARRDADFRAIGIVLEVVQPYGLAGKVIAFHFDFPEKWDSWYKPDVLYVGMVHTRDIGRLAFMCDPGWHAASTNRLSETPKTRQPSAAPPHDIPDHQ